MPTRIKKEKIAVWTRRNQKKASIRERTKKGRNQICNAKTPQRTKEVPSCAETRKSIKDEVTKISHHQIQWNTLRLVSILQPISSRNRQQHNNVKCNEIFVFKRTDCYEYSRINWRTAIYKRWLPEQKVLCRQNMIKLVKLWNRMSNKLCCHWFSKRIR